MMICLWLENEILAFRRLQRLVTETSFSDCLQQHVYGRQLLLVGVKAGLGVNEDHRHCGEGRLILGVLKGKSFQEN